MNATAKGYPPAQLAGVPFIGFVVGCMLFGCTLLQTYQYFMHYTDDAKLRKIVVAVVCSLDAIGMGFSAIMMYLSMQDPMHCPETYFLWTLKGTIAPTTLLNIIVHSCYLHLIWKFADCLPSNMISVARKACVLAFSYTLALVIVSLIHLQRLDHFSNFSPSIKRIIFIGRGSSAVLDLVDAVAVSCLLIRTSALTHKSVKSRNVVHFLVGFFIGTSVLTAITSIVSILLWVTKPSSVLYLVVEFSRPRLYANSLLAMFNSKSRLQQRMEVTSELKMPSQLLFGDGPETSTQPSASERGTRESQS